MSGGQRQMVAVARAIGFDARILIMDEPTAALGVKEANTLLDLMAGLRDQGISIILITHRISTIRRADNILYLDAGRIIENGDHDALMALEGGRYRAFVEAESHLSRATEDAGS